MEMANHKNCANKHCNSEIFGSMSFLAIYIVILFGLAVFAFVSLLIY